MGRCRTRPRQGLGFDELFADEGEPLELLGGELVLFGEFVEGAIDALFDGQDGGLGAGGMFDDGNEVGEGFVAGKLVGFLEFAFVEMVLGEGAAEFLEGFGAPITRAGEEDAESVQFVGVVPDKGREGVEVVFGSVLSSRR